MKTVFKYASLLLIGGSLLLASCSKKTDTTAPATTTPATGDAVCLSGNKTYVQIDASTNSGAASYTRNYACNVTTTQGTDTIYLDIRAKSDMDYIYMTLSTDNGASSPYIGTNALTTGNGKPVTIGSSTTYSYEIAPGINSIPAFTLKIPVSVRTSSAAVSDVYTIWMTNGKGHFSATGKNTVVGPITVALNYQSNTPYISASNITIGDQSNSSPSYLTTTGVIGVISGDSLINSNPALTSDQLTQTLNSVDINFVRLNTGGTTRDVTYTGDPYFIGVGLRTSLGFTVNTAGTNSTKFASLPSSYNFTSLSGSDISGLASPTATEIKIAAGSAYVFLTNDGRKGVINVNSLTLNQPANSGYSANVSLKVLTK